MTSLVANLISLVLVVLVAVAIGFRSGAGVLAWLGVLGILVLFTLALTWLAVIAGSPRSRPTARAGSPIRCCSCRSSARPSCRPPACPARCGWFAEHQPVTSIVNTLRNLYAEQPLGNDMWTALAWCVGLLVVAYAFAMRTYRRKLA